VAAAEERSQHEHGRQRWKEDCRKEEEADKAKKKVTLRMNNCFLMCLFRK